MFANESFVKQQHLGTRCFAADPASVHSLIGHELFVCGATHWVGKLHVEVPEGKEGKMYIIA